jgi:VanZ family protein
LHSFSTERGQASNRSPALTLAWLWAPVLAQMAAIFVASSASDVPDLPGGLSGYTGHLIGYAILGVLAIRAFAGATWAGVNRRSALRAVMLSAAYGVTDELHQVFVANRTPDAGDWLVDVAGAILGAFAVVLLARASRAKNAGSRSV